MIDKQLCGRIKMMNEVCFFWIVFENFQLVMPLCITFCMINVLFLNAKIRYPAHPSL